MALSLNLVKVLGNNIDSQNTLSSAYRKISEFLWETREDQGPPGAFLFPMLQAQATLHWPCWWMSVLSMKRDPFDRSKAPSGKAPYSCDCHSHLLHSSFLSHAEAGNRSGVQLTLICVFHLGNYFYYLNVFLHSQILNDKWVQMRAVGTMVLYSICTHE